MRGVKRLRPCRCFPVGEVLRNLLDVWCQVATASVFGRLPMQSPPLVALRKEAAGVAREAQVSWVRNGAPVRRGFFEFRGRYGARARERGCSRASGKDLEGERSPGRIGHPPAGNGRMGVTDSTAEESLEADAPVKRISKGRLWQRSRSEGTSGTGGNGKGATATVTWCGCGRVEFFEGCEQRRGKCIGTPADRVPVLYRWPGRSRNSVSGNAANPMTGSGMQQARDLPSGGSRRGGVKPRGRNRIPRQAASGPNRVGSNDDSGEWTLGRHVGGGGSRHPSFAGPRRPQGLQGPLTTQVVSARRSVCRDESQERRSDSDQGDR
jgi:hypothetical protein